MTGITQMVLTQGESIAGYRGSLANSNSLVFGQGVSTSLSATDITLMDSLNLTGVSPLGTSTFTIQYWVKHSNIQFDENIVHNNGQAIIGSTTVVGGFALLHVPNAVYVNNYLITNAELLLSTEASATQTWQRNVWYNVVVSKNTAGQITSWVNGYRSAAGIINPVLESPTSYFFPPSIIGSWRNTYGVGTTNNLIGSLYNLQFISDRVLYNFSSTQIAVPTRAYSVATTGTDLLLSAKRNATLADATGVCTLTPRAGVVNASASTPFHDEPTYKFSTRNSVSSPFEVNGSGSYSFFGKPNSYAVYNLSQGELNFGTSDFTIEWFANLQNDNRNNSCPWFYESSNATVLGINFVSTGSNADIIISTASTSTTIATVSRIGYIKLWTHWALVRSSGSLYFYRNGIILNPGGISFTNNFNLNSGDLYIAKKGIFALESETFYGYITNLRVAKAAVYSGNFTVPTDNLLRMQSVNYYGGTNTNLLKSYEVPLLMVP